MSRPEDQTAIVPSSHRQTGRLRLRPAHLRHAAAALVFGAAFAGLPSPLPAQQNFSQQQQQQVIAARSHQLAVLNDQIRRYGCDTRRHARTPECRQLNGQAHSLSQEIRSLEGRGSSRRQGGFFSWFGLDSGPSQNYSYYRTRCVRLCDGYYFPMSYSTTSGNLAAEDAKCQASCDAPAKLFYQPSDLEDDAATMVSVEGQPYSALPNAFRYRTEFVESCSCKPRPWTEAASAEYHRREVVAALTEQQQLLALGVNAMAAMAAGGSLSVAELNEGYTSYPQAYPAPAPQPERTRPKRSGGFFSRLFGGQ